MTAQKNINFYSDFFDFFNIQIGSSTTSVITSALTTKSVVVSTTPAKASNAVTATLVQPGYVLNSLAGKFLAKFPGKTLNSDSNSQQYKDAAAQALRGVYYFIFIY